MTNIHCIHSVNSKLKAQVIFIYLFLNRYGVMNTLTLFVQVCWVATVSSPVSANGMEVVELHQVKGSVTNSINWRVIR